VFDPVGFLISLLTLYGIYLILSLSLNLEYGYAGQPNFGKVAFYCIGSFTAAIVSTRLILLFYGVGANPCSISAKIALARIAASKPLTDVAAFLVSALAAVIITAAFGYMASYPALRLREDFLGIVLIASGEIVRVFLRNYYPLACGPYGLGGIPNPFSWVSDPRTRSAAFLSLVLALDAAVFILCERIANSPYGRLLKSIRDDEDAALVLGKNVTRVKGQVFIVGSALAGLAGSLYAYYVGYVNPDDFTPAVTFIVWVMVMLGGRANNLGVVLGTTIIVLIDRLSTLLDNFLTQLPFDPNYLRWLITGILMLTVLMIRPQGLIPEKPVKTPAWEVVRNGDSEDGESG